MIKPNELRIGNIVGWRDGFNGLIVGKAYELHGDKIAISPAVKEGEEGGQGFMRILGIEPIPLTPEWMRRFGFITLDAETDIEVWGMDDDSNGEEFSIISDGLDMPLPLYFEYDLGYRQVRKEIKYVHHLQNLYFALTGEELTIKGTV